jgi:hypothetical protein
MDETSQVPRKELPHVRKVSDCARFFSCDEMMLPSLSQNKIGTSELDPFRSSVVAESARGLAPRAAHRSGLDTLASSGSCHHWKATAFRREMGLLPPPDGFGWPAPTAVNRHHLASIACVTCEFGARLSASLNQEPQPL